MRTPAGVVAPTLHSSHDMFTVNEVFCREDYACGPGIRTVVDVGSNIGISALYFLTRDAGVPLPGSTSRCRATSSACAPTSRASRTAATLREAAVAAARRHA